MLVRLRVCVFVCAWVCLCRGICSLFLQPFPGLSGGVILYELAWAASVIWPPDLLSSRVGPTTTPCQRLVIPRAPVTRGGGRGEMPQTVRFNPPRHAPSRLVSLAGGLVAFGSQKKASMWQQDGVSPLYALSLSRPLPPSLFLSLCVCVCLAMCCVVRSWVAWPNVRAAPVITLGCLSGKCLPRVRVRRDEAVLDGWVVLSNQPPPTARARSSTLTTQLRNALRADRPVYRHHTYTHTTHTRALLAR